ncbi:MAG TPA: hypothetical protein VGG02_10600 [Chthoniobacterales bacterium]|jgi:hypothetical protein
MKTSIVLLAFAALAASSIVAFAAEDSGKAQEMAQAVWKAAGGENWANVETIDFTFAVEKNGKMLMQAKHHWDVPAQTDRVQWKGKDVTVNLANPAQTPDAKAAFARWTNDTYWLLAPLKLRDHGIHIVDEGTKEMDGGQREVLHLSFDKIGLTPNDNYRMYIDPATDHVVSWDYMPEPGKTMHGSWENYQQSGGLTLATEHKMGGAEIRILDLRVTAKK